MTRIHFPLALAALSILMLPQAAFAQKQTEFCKGKQCGVLRLFNGSTATVMSVKLKQLAGPNKCARIKKTYKRRPDFEASVLKTCPYTVKFKTTKGCTGDKKTEVTIRKLNARDEVIVTLEGACGTLRTSARAEYDSASE